MPQIILTEIKKEMKTWVTIYTIFCELHLKRPGFFLCGVYSAWFCIFTSAKLSREHDLGVPMNLTLSFMVRQHALQSHGRNSWLVAQVVCLTWISDDEYLCPTLWVFETRVNSGKWSITSPLVTTNLTSTASKSSEWKCTGTKRPHITLPIEEKFISHNNLQIDATANKN